MKRKVISVLLIGMTLAGMCLSGCLTNQEQSKEDDQTIQKSDLLTDVKEEYYMLPVSDYEGDIEEVLEYLIEDYTVYKNQIETTENQVETTDGWKTQYQYTLKTDGPAYKWNAFEEDYMFEFYWYKYADGIIDDSAMSVSVTDTQVAKELALAAADIFDTDLELYRERMIQNYDKDNQPAEVVAIYDFRQIYNGVPLSFEGVIDCGSQSLYCPAFDVVVDGYGLSRVGAFSMFDVGEPIKSYHVKEFISLDEVERKIQSYCSGFNINIGNEDYTMTATIESGEIVYIPYMEQNEKVLIPAYELMVLEDHEGEVWRMHYIVDVFTGYVYYRTGVDQLA